MRAALGAGCTRALTGVCLTLQWLACVEVPSAISSAEGTEVPQSKARKPRAELVVTERVSAADSGSADASKPKAKPPQPRAAESKPDAAQREQPAPENTSDDEPDAEAPSPSTLDSALSCPVRISLQTVSYGNGDDSQDDYAPNNVGAIWISKPDDGSFVRTVAAWGPTYFDHALTWLDQTRGNLVDTITLPTRASHMRPVEVSWDCRDTQQMLVAAGSYHLNLEFTEVEAQGPVLTGDRALVLQLGDKPFQIKQAPQGFFGEIQVQGGSP